MSIATAPANPQSANVPAPVFRSVSEYLEALATSDAQTAVQIALSEQRRAQLMLDKVREEYKAMSEVDFDDAGGIRRANMAGLWRLATIYAGSGVVPEHYQNKPHDCFIACQLAFRWRADPMMVMQSTFMVKGKPGFEGKLVSALLNTSGKIEGRPEYELSGEGKNRYCVCSAVDAKTGKKLSARVDWAMVEAEGWNKDKEIRGGGIQKSKWNTMPDIMFHYRSVTFLVRLHYPEVLMGMRTVEELQEMEVTAAEPAPATIADLTKKLGVPDIVEQAPDAEEFGTASTPPATEAKPDKQISLGVQHYIATPTKWRECPGLPPDALIRFEGAVTREKCDEILKEEHKHANGNEDIEAALQTARDGRVAELLKSQAEAEASREKKTGGKKSQGSLVKE